MCLIICKKCNKQIGFDDHTCDGIDIQNYIDSLNSKIIEKDQRIHNLEDSIRTLIFKYRKEIRECYPRKESVKIKCKDIEDLYSILTGADREDKLLDFTSLYYFLYSAWLETYELFCKTSSRHYKVGDCKEKLQIILKNSINLAEYMNLTGRLEDLKTVDEVIKEIYEQSSTI